MSVEYKSDIRRDGNDYLSKNAEQEVSVKLGLDYQKDDTTTSINYELCVALATPSTASILPLSLSSNAP
jgi:hypothetical protein